MEFYDGTPELLAAYKEEGGQYVMTFQHKKRYIAGPRLLKELEGTANGLPTVARSSLPEASRFVMKFYGMQRKRGETMTAWVTRHTEGL